MQRLLIMKLLWGFTRAKESVATGGNTTHPTGTGSGPTVESDLSSFETDKKKAHQRLVGSTETQGTGRWSFGPHSMQAEPNHPKQPWQIKASSDLRRGQRAAAITRGWVLRGFLVFWFCFFFFNRMFYPSPPKSLHSAQI